jgi:Zn-dependent protease with chaperone function
MTIIEGHFFGGRYPVAMKASLEIGQQETTVTAGSYLKRFATGDLIVSPRVGSTYRFISLPDGGQFGCVDYALLDSITQESQSEGIVAWLEERWNVALACVAAIAVLLLVGYFFGLPAAAHRISSRIPMETERSLGEQALTYMDEHGWLKPTGLGFEVRDKISTGFYQLCKDLALEPYYVLEFRAGAVLGPNAFAFPGGIVVITDEMVRLAGDTEEVLAVLAHEIGHVELRHTMRSVLQNSAIGLVVATVTSDAASLSAAVSALPILMAQTKYSRDFESAADEYAFSLLKHKGYSPKAFATLMERVANETGENRHSFAWISSHPVTSERIRNARDAAVE